MNTIEHGGDRTPVPEPNATGAREDLRPQERKPSTGGIPSHTFPPVPAEGVTIGQVYDMLRVDIEALRALTDPAARQLPAAFMAANMKANATYQTGLRQLAPELEAEVRAAASREANLGRDELVAPQRRAEPLSQNDLADLDARMAQSQLEELGWRDRDDLDDVMRALERLAGTDWRQAATLWDKYRPDDPDKPIFIDGDDKDPPTERTAATPSFMQKTVAAETPVGVRENAAKADPARPAHAVRSDGEAAFVAPASLRKRYLIADNKFYFREEEGRLAFEDKGKRLATDHDDPQVARSMVELAEAKNWTTITVKGSDEFRREVWLAASLRGLEVRGYRPSEVDRARLAELQREQTALPRNRNAHEHERARAAPKERAAVPEPGQAKGGDAAELGRALSPQQRVAVDTLAAILRERGDSEQTVAMAKAMAVERFEHPRVYAGKLVSHGPAPYQHKADNQASYYATLHGSAGDKTIWGADLERAIGDSKAVRDDAIAIAYQGKVRVTVQVKERDKKGKLTGKVIDSEADRNSWQVTRLDRLREEARERVYAAAAQTERGQPVVKIYDIAAQRDEGRDVAPSHAPSKQRAREPSVRR